MDFRSSLGLSSPTSSSICLSRESSAYDVVFASESIGTPATDRSTLFDDMTVPPLDLSQEEETFILVVGGLGYIGSHTTLELLTEGYNVIVVDDLSNSYRNVLDRVETLAKEFFRYRGGRMPQLKFHEADYRSPVMRSILSSYRTQSYLSPDGESRSQISGVIHFAAFKSVEVSIAKPIPYYQNNVCGMVDFVSLLQEFGIKNFVFSSSATVYGSKASKGTPLKEEDCVHENLKYLDDDGTEIFAEAGVPGITSPYGRTKWMCEAILSDIARSDPTWRITSLRYFNPVGCHSSGLLGEDPRQQPTNLIPVVMKVLTGQKPQLEIFGTDWDTSDGTAVRDFIHVSDLARGHIAALSASTEGRISEPFRAYNLGTGTGHTIREVVASIQKASSRKIPVSEVGRRKGDVGFCVASTKRAQQELGWKTQKSLDECSTDVWNFTSKADQNTNNQDTPRKSQAAR